MDAKPLPPVAAASPVEARAQLVERLCDGFSHDTRNPLNAVVIHLEVLADKLRRENAGALPAGMERNLKAIRDQVGRIDEMVRRFVELAAPHRQQEPDFDVTALVQSVVAQCTHNARVARAELRAEGPAGLRAPGSASEVGVAVALYVLGQVEAGARRLLVRTEAQGGAALIIVEGIVAAEPSGPADLATLAASCGGTLQTLPGRVELALPLARLERELHVVGAGEPGAR